VAEYISNWSALPFTGVLLGKDVEAMDQKSLKAVEKCNLFAKLSPEDKARVVQALRANGHVVGYMGDGINDAPALKAADIGISVDTAVDIAKESAHVILLEKDLEVLVDGIIEGRKTYANMIKYIKMTASSNFGNIFSELAAAALLPFLADAAAPAPFAQLDL
jgi:Mg2+-importing ATPase